MFLFFLFLFCLSSFFSIFMYLFIYLFSFYFLFQKNSSFFNMFYNERGRRDVSERGEQEENVSTARRPPRRLLRAASRSNGRVSTLAALPCPAPALPCPCPTLFVTTDRQTNKQTNKHHCCFYI
jgi:hypothetical protein